MIPLGLEIGFHELGIRDVPGFHSPDRLPGSGCARPHVGIKSHAQTEFAWTDARSQPLADFHIKTGQFPLRSGEFIPTAPQRRVVPCHPAFPRAAESISHQVELIELILHFSKRSRQIGHRRRKQHVRIAALQLHAQFMNEHRVTRGITRLHRLHVDVQSVITVRPHRLDQRPHKTRPLVSGESRAKSRRAIRTARAQENLPSGGMGEAHCLLDKAFIQPVFRPVHAAIRPRHHGKLHEMRNRPEIDFARGKRALLPPRVVGRDPEQRRLTLGW